MSMGAAGLSAVPMRPDGFVAWAADGEPELEGPAQAASRWFGDSNGCLRVLKGTV
ncbi:hypothetical protein [Mesorhizobium intechi]|uniref:aromatic-ring hydroxylase C-terminal domain-containing protein n=1 Tax=Mesorhizobium intechi TaxID=537601 RepID=UPI003CCC85AA